MIGRGIRWKFGQKENGGKYLLESWDCKKERQSVGNWRRAADLGFVTPTFPAHRPLPSLISDFTFTNHIFMRITHEHWAGQNQSIVRYKTLSSLTFVTSATLLPWYIRYHISHLQKTHVYVQMTMEPKSHRTFVKATFQPRWSLPLPSLIADFTFANHTFMHIGKIAWSSIKITSP